MKNTVECVCPICGGDIDYGDLEDEIIDMSRLIQVWSGNCVECDAKVRWKEEYQLNDVYEMEVIS